MLSYSVTKKKTFLSSINQLMDDSIIPMSTFELLLETISSTFQFVFHCIKVREWAYLLTIALHEYGKSKTYKM